MTWRNKHRDVSVLIWGSFAQRTTKVTADYRIYYNDIRTHYSLDKDAPASRPVQRTGIIRSRATLGGLHHYYVPV
jgi:hypothetical protein